MASKTMLGLAYWLWPLISALVWLGTLLGLFLTWVNEGKPIYSSMEPGQTIPFISDIGADRLKPLFIAGSCVTVIALDACLVAERWARHRGTLSRNTSTAQRVLSILAIVAALVGAVGLILVAVFDTKRYRKTHNISLAVFMGGYLVSAIFNCAEYQRLAVHIRDTTILRIPFWVKFFFIFVELALAIAFGLTQKSSRWNTSAVIEWIIALIFTLYVLSFLLDFLPVVQRGPGKDGPERAVEMAEEGVYPQNDVGPTRYHNGQNGVVREERPVTPSYNF